MYKNCYESMKLLAKEESLKSNQKNHGSSRNGKKPVKKCENPNPKEKSPNKQ